MPLHNLSMLVSGAKISMGNDTFNMLLPESILAPNLLSTPMSTPPCALIFY